MQPPVHDLIIRGGNVIDGSGTSARLADVAIDGDRITEIVDLNDNPAGVSQGAQREIDAEGKVVTPGFVDAHTHLDAQLGWDPLASPLHWHGVTSAVMGNCGVGIAPCRPEDRAFVAEMMESVEDIPPGSVNAGASWKRSSYGDYLEQIDRLPKGINAGGMVGHAALRMHAMGERAFGPEPATSTDIAAMSKLLDEAMAAGALGVSTSRTDGRRLADGRPLPGTFAEHDELLAFADVLGSHGAGTFAGAMRLREPDTETYERARSEIGLLAQISCRSGRPTTFGLLQTDARPGLVSAVIDMVRAESEKGAVIRPQTMSRGVNVLFGLEHRTPFDNAASWRELLSHRNGKKLTLLRDSSFRQQLITDADAHEPTVDLRQLFVLPPGEDPRYDCDPAWSLEAIAMERGVSPAAAFIELAIETDGQVIAAQPILNQDMRSVEKMLDEPLVIPGLAAAGAHVGKVMDASQTTYFLTYWVRERQRWTIEDAVRRLTSDPADLFGLKGRGRLVPGAFADVNVIDFDGLQLPHPEFVYDLPNDAGRYVQGSSGYDFTIVNGQVFMEAGEHTGIHAGQALRSK